MSRTATWDGNRAVRNAFQPTPGGGEDAFVAKISSEGSELAYSSFLGDSGSDRGYGIAVDCDA